MEDTLESIGLTEGEAKVYLALLELGQTKTGPIIEGSGISASKVYDILERLQKKGLASYISKARVRHYKAADPTRILDYLSVKKKELAGQEKDLKSILPKLVEKRKLSELGQEAEIFEGFKGFRTAAESLLRSLEKGDNMLILGANIEASKRLESYFEDRHRRRENKGIACRMLYNENARKWGDAKVKYKLTEVKFMQPTISTPSWVEVYNEHVLIGVPTDEPIAIVIKSKAMADSFRNYFDALWNQVSKTYTGLDEIQILLDGILESLRNKGEYVDFGVSGLFREVMGQYWDAWQKKKRRYRIKSKCIFDASIKRKNRKLLKDYYGESRFLSKRYYSPSDTIIFKDSIAIFIWTAKPPVAILIQDKATAEGYRNYFEVMWRAAKR